MSIIEQNLQAVHRSIDAAMHEAGRAPGSAKLLARHPNVDAATQDMIAALSSPRLHRSP